MRSLRFFLRLNAVTCVVFGLIFVLHAGVVAQFLGGFPQEWLFWIGALLVLHSGHLLWASFRRAILRLEIYYFSAGDLLWFLLSLLFVAKPDLISSDMGNLATIAVAVIVASIGLAQLWCHSEEANTGRGQNDSDQEAVNADLMPADLSRLAALGHSWLGIKTWVKVWLFALNGAFLAVFLFASDDLTKVILLAYFATVPLLLAIMIVQRGLTRLLGLAHLVPWLPLVGYLFGRLTTDAMGPRLMFGDDPVFFFYVVTLLCFVIVCLVFDVYDLFKWATGNRSRLGSENDRRNRSGQRTNLS